MSLSLVVCADDFALNPGVSRAIVELAELGRISATSAMVCAPHWQAHAPWLRDLSGHIGVGLHLDLTSPWAQRESHGQGLGRAIGHSLLRLTDATTAEQVIANQLDRFEQVWQAPPDHIDGHQHVQQFAVWREALVRLVAQRYRPGQRPWLRVSRPVPADRGFKTWLIGAMGASQLDQLSRAAHIPCSRHLVGISDFQGDAAQWLRQAAQWLDWVSASDGAVMMCHPGLADPDTSDGIASARKQEWLALASPDWPALLQQHGVILASRMEAKTP